MRSDGVRTRSQKRPCPVAVPFRTLPVIGPNRPVVVLSEGTTSRFNEEPRSGFYGMIFTGQFN